jgi:hypothetical protein
VMWQSNALLDESIWKGAAGWSFCMQHSLPVIGPFRVGCASPLAVAGGGSCGSESCCSCGSNYGTCVVMLLPRQSWPHCNHSRLISASLLLL